MGLNNETQGVSTFCKCCHHHLGCVVPLSPRLVRERVPYHFPSSPGPRKVQHPVGNGLAYADTHDEICEHLSSLRFWFKFVSLYIDISDHATLQVERVHSTLVIRPLLDFSMELALSTDIPVLMADCGSCPGFETRLSQANVCYWTTVPLLRISRAD